jgi:maleylpyruvate isomerase
MTERHDLSVTLAWMRQGTSQFLERLESMTDDELRGPSSLPGWSRAHLTGHLARNAEALARLATWARTGVETPMYASRHQRGEEIERSARQPASVLRSDALSTARQLDEALAALDGETWSSLVRSAMGRSIQAAEIPWMRAREVWLHAVDLDAGLLVADLPGDFVDTLLDDVVPALSQKPFCPAVTLTPTDRDRTWRLGPPGAQDVTPISGPAADLAGWVTGRLAGTVLGDHVPELPPWL